MAEQKTFFITRDGLQELQNELTHLKGDRRKEIAEKIKEAISYGDLSENAEYAEAREQQAFVEGRIRELEDQIKKAQIISDTHGTRVNIGSTIILKNLTKEMPEEKFTIVGSIEADMFKGLISNESPVGQSVLGKSKGDKIQLKAPAGQIEYQIADIV